MDRYSLKSIGSVLVAGKTWLCPSCAPPPVVTVLTVETVVTVVTVVTVMTVLTEKLFSVKKLCSPKNLFLQKLFSQFFFLTKTQVVTKLQNSNCDKAQD